MVWKAQILKFDKKIIGFGKKIKFGKVWNTKIICQNQAVKCVGSGVRLLGIDLNLGSCNCKIWQIKVYFGAKYIILKLAVLRVSF